MNEKYDVLIAFTDGTQQRVTDLASETVRDGVLRLFREPYYGVIEPAGCYPLSNIRSWGKVR